MAQTLQEHYNSIKSGKGNKAQFLRQVREMFPQYFNQYSDFDTATNVLKSKQIISEAAGGVVSKGFSVYDWKKILGEEVKATEKETSKEVKDNQSHAFQPSDIKNADNVNFNEIMKGFFAEMYDEKNKDKTGDEIKAMVVKNLAKDVLYYTKNGNFSTMGVGYTTEAPGLGEPKVPKGKFKSSGYGDIEKEVKVKANVKDSLGDQEAKDSMPKKVKEMPDKGVSGVEKKIKLQEGIRMFNDPIGYDKNAKSQMEQARDILTDAGLSKEEIETFIDNNLFSKGRLSDKAKEYIETKKLEETHADPHGVAGDEEKEKEAKSVQVKKPNPNVKENKELSSKYSEYSNDALKNMIINLSRFKDNEDIIQMVKDELKKRKEDLMYQNTDSNLGEPIEEQKLRSLIRNLINEEIK